MEPPACISELLDATIASDEGPRRARVQNVTWRIGPGDFWVVGGLAGSGKSLLIEAAAGLRRPVAGELKLFGSAAANALASIGARGLRRRIGFVYGRGGRLLSHLTVAENLALPLCYHRNCDQRAVADELGKLLARFGLARVADRLPGQVNPAFRQRAALARALALEPDVVFLDDPLAELNTGQVRWWTHYLGGTEAEPGFPRRPATWVVATDDLRPWLALGRQFGLIQDGRWRVLGGREALVDSPEPLLRELLAETPAGS